MFKPDSEYYRCIDSFLHRQFMSQSFPLFASKEDGGQRLMDKRVCFEDVTAPALALVPSVPCDGGAVCP